MTGTVGLVRIKGKRDVNPYEPQSNQIGTSVPIPSPHLQNSPNLVFGLALWSNVCRLMRFFFIESILR